MISHYIVLAALAAVLVWAVLVYNGLVAVKNGVAKAWSNIDVLLVQRHDEIPKLVEVCKAHMQFERDTLERVMRARAAVDRARMQRDPNGLGPAEGALRQGIGRIAATMEAYPELKAD